MRPTQRESVHSCWRGINHCKDRVGSSSEQNADDTNMTILGGKVQSRATLVVQMMQTRPSYSDQAFYDRVEPSWAADMRAVHS